MVACKKCSTENSLDSLFCRQCGEAIASDERSEAQLKHENLIAEGYRIFNEGRTGEARLVAESCLAENPHSTSALSLKGMCHERAGELAEALGAYERVVELNPDSALDKIKVTHLRQSISGKTLVEAPPPRTRAVMGAAAAVVLVVAVGVAIATSNPAPQTVSMKTGIDPKTAMTDAFDSAELQSPGADKPATENPNPAVQSNPQIPPQANPQATNPGAGTRTPPFRFTPSPRGVLPDVNRDSLEGPIGPRPVTLDPPKNLRLTPETPVGRSAEEGPDPKIDSGGGASSASVEPAKTQEEPPIIEIKVSNPRPNTPGGSSPVSNDGGGAESLLKAANQQFLLGRFSQAAASYESALRAGASSGSTNQRIAQSYANLGNKTAAAAAYRRAISAYERSGDSPRTRSALEACRQALKVLGG